MEASILDATTSESFVSYFCCLTLFSSFFYALNPDGSLRWKYQTGAEVSVQIALAASFVDVW
jgi:hypothetical protein